MNTKLFFLLALVAGFLLAATGSMAAATYTIGANTAWSAIAGGPPTSADSIIVSNSATLTVDMANAQCASVQLAATTGTGTGTLAFNSGSQLTVSGTVTVGGGGKAGSINMTSGGTLIATALAVSTAGTWTPGTGTVQLTANNTLPTSFFTTFNNLTVSAGTTTMGASITAGGNLTVADGATFASASTFTLGVTGTTTVGTGTSGTLTLAGTGTKTFTGDVTINSGGIWNETGAATYSFAGNLQNNGSWTANTGTHSFTGTTKTIGGANAISIPTMTVTGTYANSGTLTSATLLTVTSPGGLTNNGTITATTALSGTGTLTQSANSTLNIGGTVGITTLTATATPNLVNYNGAAQTVKSTTYNALTVSGGSTKSLGGAIVVNGDLTIGTGTTLDTVSLSNYGITLGGNWINNGTFTPESGTVTFNGSAAQTLGGSVASQTFYSITVNNPGQTLSVGGSTITLTLNGTMTLTAGTFDAGTASNINVALNWSNNGGTFVPETGTVTFTGGTADNINGTATSQIFYNLVANKSSGIALTTGGSTATLTVNNFTETTGNFTPPATFNINGSATLTAGALTAGANIFVAGNWSNIGGTFTPGSGTVTFNGSSAQTLGGTATTQTFNNIAVNNPGQTLSVGGSTTTLTLNGGMTLTAGTFATGTAAGINVAGNWSNNGGTFTPGSGTVTFTGNSMAINGTTASQTFNNLTVNKTAGQTLSVGGSTTGLTVNNFTETTGNFAAPAALDVAGNAVLTAGTFTAGANITAEGNWTNNGTTFTPGAGTVTFDGTGTQSIAGSATTQTFNNLTVNNSGTLSVGGSTTTLTLNGDLTLTAGTFVPKTTLNIAGDWLNNGGAFTPGTGTVVFNGTGAQAINGTTTDQTFNNLTVTKTTGTLLDATSLTSLTVNGNFTETTGNFTAPATLDVNGNMTLTAGTFTAPNGSGTFTVAGNWADNGATFSPNGGIVTFNGTTTQSISGSTATPFKDLEIANPSATVSGTANFNVAGTMTVDAGATFSPSAAVVINSASPAGTLTGSGTIQVTRTAATADLVNQYKFTTYSLGGLTVNYSAAAAQTVDATSAVGNYGALQITGGGSYTKTLGGAVTVNGDLTIAASTTLAVSASNYGISVGGNWSNSGNFTQGSSTVTLNGAGSQSVGGSTATTFYNMTVNKAGGTATAGVNFTVASLFNISAGTFDGASQTITLSGSGTPLVVTGAFTPTSSTVTYSSTSGTTSVAPLTYNNLTISGSGGTFNAGGATTINGALNVTAGTFNANGQTVNVTGLTTVSGGIYQASTATQTLNGGLTVSGGTFTGSSGTVNVVNVTLSSGTLTAPNGSGAFNVSGNWSQTAGTFTSNGGTVTLNGTAQNIGGSTFNSLTLSGTVAATTTAAITVGGSLAVPSGTTLTEGAYNLSVTGTTTVGGLLTHNSVTGTMTLTGDVTISGTLSETAAGAFVYGGNVTINNGGTLTENGAATMSCAGNFEDDGTYTASTGVHTFSGTAKTIGGASSIAIPSLTISGTCTNTGMLTVATALAGSGGLTQGANATLNLGGTAAITALTASASSNMVSYTGAAQTIHGNNYYYLNLSGSAAKTLQTGMTAISGDLTLSGTVTATTVTNLAVSGDLNVGAGTTLTEAGFNLSVTGTTTVGGLLTHNSATGTMTLTGDLTISGTLTETAAGAFVYGGNVTINNGGTLTENGAATMSCAGNFEDDGTYTASTGVHTFSGTAKTIGGASSIAIPSLTISGTCTNTGTLTVATALAGSGGLTQGANATLNLGGTAAITALTASASGNTVSYTGAGQAVNATAYYDLIFSGSGAKTNLTGTSVSDNLSIAPTGTAKANIGAGLTINVGSLTLGGLDRISGTWGGTGSGATYINTNYFAATTGMLNVSTDSRTAPTVTTWPTASAITYGSPLSTSTLSGGSAPAGTFVFTSPSTIPGAAGIYSASVTFTATDTSSYNTPVTNNVNVTVNPKALTVIGVNALAKVYDRTNTATIDTTGAVLVGVVGADIVNLSGTPTGTFATIYVANNINVTISGLTLSGDNASNYTLTQPTDTANITAQPLTISSGLTGVNRNYNGINAATIVSNNVVLAGVISPDAVTIRTNGYTATFADENVGAAKAITISGLTLSTGAGTNYSLTMPTNLTANIAQTNITVTATTNTKIYDGTTNAAGIPTISANGLQAGDTNGFSENYTSATVGTNKTLVPTGAVIDGNSGANYNVTFVNSTNGTISALALTVTGIVASDKVYDHTNLATLDTSAAALVGVISPDDVTLITNNAVGRFATIYVASNITVTITNLSLTGADAGNYSIINPTDTANITAKPLAISSGLAGVNRNYNGTNTATISSNNVALVGVISPDAVTIRTNGYTATFADENVGTAKAITISGLTLSTGVGTNYSLTTPTNLTANIAQTNITVTATTNTKIYDGTTSVTNSPTLSANAIQTGDTANFTEAYSTDTVGVGNKTIVPSGSVSDGNGGANYNVTFVNFTTATINPLALTVTGITVSDKVYDRTNLATLDTSAAALVGVINPDVVTLITNNAVGRFATIYVATNITVTITNLSLTGADAGNYSIINPTDTASITAKPLTVSSGLAGVNRNYNGTNTATISSNNVVLVGVISPDAVTIRTNGYTAAFADENVGAAKAITISGLTLSTGVGTNYSLTTPSNLTANIAQTNITVTAVANNKVYDGSTNAAGIPTISANGLQAGDTNGFSENYTSATVGTNKTLVPTGAVIDGNNGANYNVTFVNSTNGIITPGPASQIAFVQEPPASVIAGVVISPSIKVQVQDAFNNVVPGTSVTMTLNDGGTLGGTAARISDATGTATFTNLTASLVGSGATFTASVTTNNAVNVISSPFAVTPGAIHHYAVSAAAATRGTAFNVTVTAQDVDNNTVTTDNSTVVSMTSSTGNALFDANGDSTFNDNSQTLSGGTFTISTEDNFAETVTITATDANVKTGSTSVALNGLIGDYRSQASGNWNATNTWQTWSGSAWVTATTTPTSTNSGEINVRSPNTVTVTNSVSVVAGMYVLDAGGTNSINSGQTLTVGNGVANGIISGSGILKESGTSTLLDLNGNNTYSGGTVISGGTVSVTNINATGVQQLGSGSLTFDSGGTLLNTGPGAQSTAKAFTFNTGGGVITMSGNTITVTGTLSGGGGLTTSGSDFILNRASGNNAIGPITVNSGRLFVFTTNSIGGSAISAANGATVDFSVTGAIAPANTMTFASGSCLANRGTGTLTVSTAGVTFPTAGTMIFNNDDQASTAITINGNYPTLADALTVQIGGGNASVGAVTLSGALGGNAGLIKTLNGVLVLSGTNTYSGGTTVSAGNIDVKSTGTLGTSDVTVAGGATLTLESTTSIASTANLLLNTSAIVTNSFTGTNNIQRLSFDGGATFQVTGTWGASSVAHTNTTFFKGTGKLNVLGLPTSTTVASSVNPTTFGDAVTFTATVSGTGGTPTGTVQFKTNNVNFGSAVALSSGSASGAAISTLPAGSNTVTVVYSGDTVFAVSTGVLSGGQIVNKATPVISWGNPADITYGTALSSAQLNATSGGIAGSFVYTPPSGTVLNAGAGQTLSVHFTPADTADYNTPTDMTVSINVNKADQTITFASGTSTNKIYGNVPFADTATTTSGGTVTYSSDNTDVATVNASGTVTIVASGTAHILADSAATANYNAAPEASQTLTVNPLPVILFGTRAYDTTTNAAADILSVTNKVGGDDISVVSGTGGLANMNVGTESITSFGDLALGGTNVTNYTLTNASGTVAISAITLTYTADTVVRDYGVANPTFTGTLTGFIGSENQDNATTGTLTFTSPATPTSSVGSYAINGSGLTATNYIFTQAAGNATALTVNAATPVISWSTPADIAYGTALGGAQLNATSGGVAGSFIYTPPSGTVLNAGAGQTLSVQFTPADTTNYNTPAVQTVSINVNMADQTITFGPLAAKTYGDAAFGLTATANSGLTVNFASSDPTVATVTSNIVTILKAGTTTITASQAGNPNYNAATDVLQTLTVNALPVMLTGTRVYDGTMAVVAEILSVTNRVGSDDVSVASGSGTLAGATVGSQAITSFGDLALGGSASANYMLTGAGGAVNITVAGLAATNLLALDKIYDGTTNATLDATNAGLAGVLNGDDVSLVDSNGAAYFADKNVGTNKPVTVEGLGLSGAAAANYALAEPTNIAGTISPLAITVTAVHDRKQYDGTTSSTGVPTISPALAAGDSPNFTQSFDTPNVGGGKTLTPGGNVSDGNGGNNYAITFASDATGEIAPTPVPTSQWVAIYRFSEGTGTTTTDASGNDNIGTLSNAVWSSEGKYGNCLAFDGTAWVTANDSPSLDLTNGMTLEAWVYPTNAPGQWTTFVMKEAGNNLDYAIQADPSGHPTVYISTTTVTNQGIVGPSPLPLNTWTHIAGTYDGTNLVLYINGAMVNNMAVSGSILTSSQPLRIGGNSVWGEYFSGKIDEVRICNQALSQSQILMNMTGLDVLTVTVDGTNRVYGAENPAFTGSVSGLLDGDNITTTFTTIATPDSPVGNYDILPSFTDSDGSLSNYIVVTNSGTLTVNLATPELTLSASAITYGQTLAASSLGGSAATNAVNHAPVDGTFAFTDDTIAPNAGNTNVAVIFTPTDTADFNPVTNSVTVTVNAQTPAVAVPVTASVITYGQTLANSVLGGAFTNAAGAAVAGTLAFADDTIAPNAGGTNVAVIFTPEDATDYNPVTNTVSVTVNAADQTIAFGLGSTVTKTFGDASFADTAAASSGLTVTYASSDPTVATVDAVGTVTILKAGSTTMTANQPGDANHNAAAEVSQTLLVNAQTPAVSVPVTANAITYGQTLANSVLGGAFTNAAGAAVAGTLAFADDTIAPNAGSTNVPVIFTPDDTNYAAVATAVDVTVNLATPELTLSASAITYGQTLAASSLGGSAATNAVNHAPVDGTFAFTDDTIAPNAGNTNVAVIFTPTDTADFNPVTNSVTVTVNAQTPAVAVPVTASAITYGQTLANSVLGGAFTNAAGAAVAGTLAFADDTIAPNAGGTNVAVIFTPEDATDYNPVTNTVSVTVNAADQTIAFGLGSTVTKTFGDASFADTAAASSGLTVTYASSDPTVATVDAVGTVTILKAGSTTMTANQPGDANHNAAAEVSQTLLVNAQTPAVSVPVTANAITYGQTLANSVLGGAFTNAAGAAVAGTLAFADDTIAPNAGSTNVPVIFTPDDTNYAAVATAVDVTVNLATPELTLSASAITYGQTLAASSLGGSAATNAVNHAPVDGTFAFTDDTIAPNAGNTNVAVIFTPTDTADFNPVTNSVTVTVNKAAVVLVLVSSAQTNGYRDSVSFTATNLPADAGSNVVFSANGVLFSTNDVVNGAVTSLNITNLPRGDTNIIVATYNGDGNYFAGSTNLVQTVTNHPPVAQPMTVYRTAGTQLLIALADVATNWSDADSDLVTLTGVNLTTTNSVNLQTNSSWILCPTNSPNVNDQFNYGIADGYGGTNIGYINIVVNSSVTGTNSITSYSFGSTSNVITAYGIPGYSYILERATNLAPAVWIDVSTNVAATNGVIRALDNFSELGGTPPSSAYYRLKWQP